MKHLVSSSLDRDLHLVLQLLYLVESVVKLHLQVVSFENHSFEMHLLTSDHMLFEFSALLLNIGNVLHLFGVSSLRLWHLAHCLLKSLHCIIEIPLTTISDVLHDIKLLLKVRDLLIGSFALLELLVRHFKVYLLKDEYFRGEIISIPFHLLHGIYQLIAVFLQLAYNIIVIVQHA